MMRPALGRGRVGSIRRVEAVSCHHSRPAVGKSRPSAIFGRKKAAIDAAHLAFRRMAKALAQLRLGLRSVFRALGKGDRRVELRNSTSKSRDLGTWSARRASRSPFCRTPHGQPAAATRNVSASDWAKGIGQRAVAERAQSIAASGGAMR